MVSKEKLEERHAFLMRGNDLLESAQLEIVISHLELYALLAEKEKEIEVYKKESVLKNQLINQYKEDIENFKIIVSRQSSQIAEMGGALDEFNRKE